MADIQVVTCVWSGFAGGPGTSTFHFSEPFDQLDDLQVFFGSCLAHIPDAVHIEIPTSGSQVDEVTGDLTGAWTADPVGALVGGATGNYASGVGATVRWNSEGIINSRQVRGHTYMVPLHSASFDTDGTLTTTAKGVLSGAAGVLRTAYDGSLCVWHRPVSGAGGAQFPVTSTTIPDRPAFLSSRRG